MAWLPWHVDLEDARCDCMDSRWDVETIPNGTTTEYVCGFCGALVADLICGAEP